MDLFLEAYFKIDVDSSEEITVEELVRYMEMNNFKQEFVQKWLEVFDENKDGVISLEEYCDVLGLVPKNARLLREEFVLQQSAMPRRTLPKDVSVIFSNVSKESAVAIVDLEVEAWKGASSPKEVARHMKEGLDMSLGPTWHVVVVKGQYWLYCTATSDGSFHYKRGNYIYMVWKTLT